MTRYVSVVYKFHVMIRNVPVLSDNILRHYMHVCSDLINSAPICVSNLIFPIAPIANRLHKSYYKLHITVIPES